MHFFQADAELDRQVQSALEATWREFPGLARNQIALTWLVYDDPCPVNTGGALDANSFWQIPVRGSHYRGDETIYPASIVKLFYLVAAMEWLQQGMLFPDPEIDRALRDMIADSSNDATSLILDLLTGTTSGPSLAEGPFRAWAMQRQIVNRYFKALGWPELESINCCQKTWGDGPYGRERDFYGATFENRNRLTTNATTRLLHAIAGGVAVSAPASQQMMDLLRRSLDPGERAADPENQVDGFIGEALPEGSRLWSKAGWMSQARHDTAYVERPGRSPVLLTIFTEGATAAQATGLLPFITGQLLSLS